MSFRHLRGVHEKSEAVKKYNFKREFSAVVKEVQERSGADSLRVFAMDEHRMGLQPIHRKQWSFKGQRSKPISIKYDWLWVYGFVEPASGENHMYMASHLNKKTFEMILRVFAKEACVQADNPVLLILDQAGAHKNLKLPEGIFLHFLPLI